MQVQVYEPQDRSNRINRQGRLLSPHSCSRNWNGNHVIANSNGSHSATDQIINLLMLWLKLLTIL